jgi:hypothetical protein
VHADDAGQDGATAQIEDGHAVARQLVRTRQDRCDLAVGDPDVAIGERRSAGAVDDLHVLENHFRRVDAQVLANLRPEPIDALRSCRAGPRRRRYA